MRSPQPWGIKKRTQPNIQIEIFIYLFDAKLIDEKHIVPFIIILASVSSIPTSLYIRIMTKLYLDCVKMIRNHFEFHSCIPRDTYSQFQSFQSLVVVVVSVIETSSMRPITPSSPSRPFIMRCLVSIEHVWRNGGRGNMMRGIL